MLATFGAGKKFLSTPSGWRATVRVGCQTVGNRHISIHALRVEGDAVWTEMCGAINISIHALRVEGDLVKVHRILILLIISIHALRVEGDVGHEGRVGRRRTISIHALRVEGDAGCCR